MPAVDVTFLPSRIYIPTHRTTLLCDGRELAWRAIFNVNDITSPPPPAVTRHTPRRTRRVSWFDRGRERVGHSTSFNFY